MELDEACCQVSFVLGAMERRVGQVEHLFRYALITCSFFSKGKCQGPTIELRLSHQHFQGMKWAELGK
eukprot:1157528-Pelagomonas_calceolata.AAC.5